MTKTLVSIQEGGVQGEMREGNHCYKIDQVKEKATRPKRGR